MASIIGKNTVNGKLLIEVDDDPSTGAGVAAPIGSIAMFSDGAIGSQYSKIGPADTDWIIFATGSGPGIVQTNDYYVDGGIGNDLTATGDINMPFQTIQACLNMIGQPVNRVDAMRHISIHISDSPTALEAVPPQTFDGCYNENLTVPSRMITFYGAGVKIGDNNSGGPSFGNILKEYSSSRRFGATSSELRPCLSCVGVENTRDSQPRLRDGFHIAGTCRTTILQRNLDNIFGDGVNQITVHVAPGQFTYPITVSVPPTPFVVITITGTANYNGSYNITGQIDATTFTATRLAGINAAVAVEVAGAFFEADSAGASGITHDAHFINTYMQGAYTCDDGVVNGGAVTAGTEVMYAVNSRFFTGVTGANIQLQRWDNVTLAGTNAVSSIAGMNNCSFSGSLSVKTFVYATDDMAFMNCRFNAALVFTVLNAGQTVRMDSVTYTSFLNTGSSWATNTPTLFFLDSIVAINRPRTPTAVSVGATNKDYIIGVTSTAAARTITLPAANSVPAGFNYIIKDESGAAAVNNITVARAGADTIDGAVSAVINTNYGVVRLYSDGVSKWFLI